MINENSIKAVNQSTFKSSFRKPLYDSYCFYQIPKTIPSLFTANHKGLPQDTLQKGPYENVILLFIDAFGWKFFEKYKSSLPFLQKVEKKGIVSKLTSQFPSTTAAHVTCVHTGLPPNQSGLYEWFIYEPRLNDIIAPLPFCYAGERKLGTLPLDPAHIFPQNNIYKTLKESGIRSHCFQPSTIINSPFSKKVLEGAEVHGYKNPKEGLDGLLDQLKGKTYAHFYYGNIDSVGHRKGIYSEDFSKEIKKIFTLIDDFSQKLPPKTALIVTADHGMVEVDPKTTYYLNKSVPNIDKYLKMGARNKALAPAGSCRDYFVHAREESLSELQDILSHFLEDKAVIVPTEQLINEGFFGPNASSDAFLSRVGNLAILPYQGESIWWYEKGRHEQNFYGAHGGLTPQEMEIPFLFYQS